MNNKIIQNNGNQYFQENNYYGSDYGKYKTTDCIKTVEKVGKLSWAAVAVIVGIIADIVTIVIALKELKTDGLWTMLHTYKLHIYTLIVSFILVFIIWLCRIIFELLSYKSSRKYILRRNEIYKLILQKCPVCGDMCNGKLKIALFNGGTYCICHRDKTHKWKIEYNDVMRMIK